MKNKDPRAGMAALTHERPQELERTLRQMEAWHETRKVWRDGQAQGVPGAALWSALAGLPWVLVHRRVLPPAVVGMIVKAHGGPPPVRRRRLAVMPGAQR